LLFQIDPKVAFPRRAHPKVSEKLLVTRFIKSKVCFTYKLNIFCKGISN
jgi:hypothetical protein